MSALDVIEWAAAEGVQLQVRRGRIALISEQRPPADLVERLKEHRQEIIETLTSHYRETLSKAAGVPFDWLVAHYFTTEDLADIEAGKFPSPVLLGEFIKTDPRYPFG